MMELLGHKFDHREKMDILATFLDEQLEGGATFIEIMEWVAALSMSAGVMAGQAGEQMGIPSDNDEHMIAAADVAFKQGIGSGRESEKEELN